ncbi:MAG: plastocyanin/azurin family copper-binding protein [Actinomycetota bacterium]|nr:plastocyanin/azurin family copper-binding protein [Actinomycetota bacterium]
MNRRRLILATLAVLSLFSLAACGGADDRQRIAAPSTGTAAATVVIDGMAFSPEGVEIAVGESVVWTFKDDTTHDVAFDDGPTSPKQRSGTWQRTFDQPGSYEYVCTLHPNMRGTVVVR